MFHINKWLLQLVPGLCHSDLSTGASQPFKVAGASKNIFGKSFGFTKVKEIFY